MKEFFIEGPQDYKLMTRAGVRQYCYPQDCTHNAIWDSIMNHGLEVGM